MGAPADIKHALAVDAQSLDQLKLLAKRDPKQAIGAVSKQFEVLFLNLLLKSMREAAPQDGIFDSDQTRLYTSMLDQQLAQRMAARGIGLADVIARQLARVPSATAAPSAPVAPAGSAAIPAATNPAAAPDPATAMVPKRDFISRVREALKTPAVTAPIVAQPAAGAPLPLEQTRDFVNRVWKYATDAARATGIQAHFMVGQAALESGWGRHELRAADGTPTHNLFGVKAGRNWTGPVVEKATTEYVNGVAQTVTAKFRVYDSYAESFRDYARLLLSHPRFGAVLGQSQDAVGFARGLQQAGYATDPAYADKLIRVINGDTLRRSLASGPNVQGPALM